MLGVRTEAETTRFWANRVASRRMIRIPLATGGVPYSRRIALSVIDRVAANPMPRRSSGMWPTPAATKRVGGRARHLDVVNPYRSARDRAQPGEDLRQLALAVAGHAGNPQDFALADCQRKVSERRQPAIARRAEPARLQHRRTGRPLHSVLSLDPLLSDQKSRQGVDVAFRGEPAGDDLTGTQHRDTVGRSEHLLELVRDEHDAAPSIRNGSDDGKQFIGFGWGQNRGRLIEDQDARPPGEDAKDLNSLLLAGGELPYLGLRIHMKAEMVAQLAGPPCQGLDRGAPWRLFPAKVDVLGDRLRLHQAEVLMYHADSSGDGLGRGAK